MSSLPFGRRDFAMTLAIVVGVLVLLIGAWWAIKEITGIGCGTGERDILEEFPQYGGRRIEPYSGEVSCNVRYPTRASRDEVLGYYDERLRENGWEVGGFWAADPPRGIEFFGERLSDVSAAPESVGGGLGARRDGYRYGVTYSPPGTGDPGETPGGEEVSAEDAEVIVEVNDEPEPPGGKGGSPKK